MKLPFELDAAHELEAAATWYDRERDVRRFSVLRFPYSIVTAMVDGRRTVVAVAHASREPDYWAARVK